VKRWLHDSDMRP